MLGVSGEALLKKSLTASHVCHICLVVKIEQTIFVLPLVKCHLFYGIINRLNNNRNFFLGIIKNVYFSEFTINL